MTKPPTSEESWGKKIDELVRDITKVGFMPKSEAYRRIAEIYQLGLSDGEARCKDYLDRKSYTIGLKMGFLLNSKE